MDQGKNSSHGGHLLVTLIAISVACLVLSPIGAFPIVMFAQIICIVASGTAILFGLIAAQALLWSILSVLVTFTFCAFRTLFPPGWGIKKEIATQVVPVGQLPHDRLDQGGTRM